MNVKFLNPFVEAASEVLKAEVNLAITRGNLSMQKSSLTADDVTVMISLVGNVQGVVLYGMSTQTSLAIVSRILDQEFHEFDTLAQSGVAEIGNVVTGRATIKLSEAGYQANISPPTLIIGQGIQVSTLDFPRLIVPLVSEVGEIMVHLALRESPPGAPANNFLPLEDVK